MSIIIQCAARSPRHREGETCYCFLKKDHKTEHHAISAPHGKSRVHIYWPNRIRKHR